MHYPKQLASANGFNSLYLRKIWNSPREQRTDLQSQQAHQGLPGLSAHPPEKPGLQEQALGHQLIPCWDRSRGSCQTCFSATEAQCFGHHKIDPKRAWLKLLSWKHSIDWIALPNPVSNHKQHLLDNLQHLTQHLLDNGSSHCQNKAYPNYSYFLSTHQESQDYLFHDTTYLL